MPTVVSALGKYRAAGAGLAAVAAPLLVFGSWATSWWRGSDAGIAIAAGLRIVENCGAEGCRDAPLSSLGSGAWMQLGIAAFTFGMVGAALLLAAVARAVKPPKGRPVVPGAAAIACALAVLLGIATVLLAPENVARMGVGPAMITFFSGGVIGAAAAGALLSPAAAEGTRRRAASAAGADEGARA